MFTAADGTELALHRWTAPDNAASVFYLHGIQSHAGWLYETGPELLARGVDLYALDRRGSGCSGGERGHLPSAEQVVDDYARAIAAVSDETGERPLTLLGQSLGGSVLAALWCSRPLLVDKLIFCAPALGQQRSRYDPAALAERRSRNGSALQEVGLKDTDYTDLPGYRTFLAADPLMLREITPATQATLVHIEDRYFIGSPLSRLPVDLVVPERDPVIDLSVAQTVLDRLAPLASTRVFASGRHYLEFTEARTAYWDWLAARIREI